MSLFSIILAAVTFCSPVKMEVSLSGNFGEPRPNHLHGGLDIKTQHEEGKAVYAIGDGYVSRVSVNLKGMGNAIYIKHPNGYTSAYGHLQKFAPGIEALVRKWQYQHHCTDVNITLDATDFPVAQGQIIALSGDTGNSFGPHLHLEIHRNDNWNMMDPLAFIPDLLNDSVSPKAHALMVYPQPGEGMVCGETTPQRFDFNGNQLKKQITAWGKVGFGLFADDYMQGSTNCYGVRYTTLLVDGKEVFSSDMDNIPVSDNKQVSLWGDYDYYAKNSEWFLRSFRLPGNTLAFFKTDANGGFVQFNEERDYQVKYIISDFFGNKSEYQFVVKGQKDSISVQIDEKQPVSAGKVAGKIKNPDEPPLIIPINQRQWNEQPVLIFDLKGKSSRVTAHEGYVDDQFVLFDYVKKSSRIICDLRKTPVMPLNRERQLKVLATDSAGHTSTYTTTIFY